MSTTSATEEIEELRAKAIASMPSSSNPSSAPKPKSPESREDGEISPSDDASLPLEEQLPTVAEDNQAQIISDCTIAKALPSSSPSMAAQNRTSVTRRFSKHFKRAQMPFKSIKNQNLSWHGKGSDNNLVISFSDDESGTDSGESKSGKGSSMKDNVSRANNSGVATASASTGLQGGPNRTKPSLKKGYMSLTGARLTSSRHLVASVEKDPSTKRHIPITKTTARLEHANVPTINVACHRLEGLRHEIAQRENELKAQTKLVPPRNEKTAGSDGVNHGSNTMPLATKSAGVRRTASVAGIGLAPKEKMTKQLKPALDINNKKSSVGQFQLPSSSSKSAHNSHSQFMETSQYVNKEDTMESDNDNNDKQQHAADTRTAVSSGLLLKVKDSRSIVSAPAIAGSTPVSSKHNNHFGLVAPASLSHDKSDKRDMAADYPITSSQMLLQSDININEGALRESNMCHHKDMDKEHARHSITPSQINAPSLHPDRVIDEHDMRSNQQILATSCAQLPLETSSSIPERGSGQFSDSRLVNDKAALQNNSILNYTSHINFSGEASMNLQSLVELEDLQDKDLEEAQEFRRRCELEERRALKAYRKAQRALADANEKCSLLYKKRELFSAQLRALLMQDSSSLWPSGWQSCGGTASKSTETAPHANFDLLSSMGHQLPFESQVLGQLGFKSSTRQLVEQQPSASYRKLDDCAVISGQRLEQDASRAEHIDNSPLDGALPAAHHPNLSNDNDEESPFQHRPIQFRLDWNAEKNHDQTTADVNEPERLPSDENTQDYELLEASLRSKLVKRLGSRMLSKNNIDDTERLFQDGADKIGNITKSAYSGQQFKAGDRSETVYLEGGGRLVRSTDQLTTDSQSPDNDLPLTDEAHGIKESQVNSFFHAEDCGPIKTTGSALPSSLLHVASRHAKSMLVDWFGELSSTEQKEAMLREKFTESPVEESTHLYRTGLARIGEQGLHSHDHAIDPFWPFCMFELRGKCNNEECRWQHVKQCSLRNLKRGERLATPFTDHQGNHLLSHENSDNAFGPSYGLFHHILPIPTYHIGSNLIKVDPHLCRSVLARSNWQYWQRGFCASFSVPFSIQRILPSDAPFLQTVDAPGADDCYRNRLSLYYQTQDDSMQAHGLPECEQSLEMALDYFGGSGCKPDRKKALSMLSRAIEVEPTFVVLWVVYLHIFYAKEKNIGKDDMFFHAVQHNKGSYDLWLMYINSRMQQDDQLDAYEYALTTFCQNKNAFEKERRYLSACILDIFLQMIDFLCMSGNEEAAILKIFRFTGKSGDTSFLDIHPCLTFSDRCIFWICCVYLAVYKKLPEIIVQQFEFGKELPFGIEWPFANLTTDRKEHALVLMKLAVDKMALDTDINPHRSDQASLRSLHFLAVSHVRCVAALEGLYFSAQLLAKYLSLYPTCIELILISCRLKENYTGDAAFKSFEELLSGWPRESPGIQCLWNQYVEHVLADRRIDFAEILLERCSQDLSKATKPHDWKFGGREHGPCDSFDLPAPVNSDDCFTSSKKDDIFGLLNLCLYKMLQKNLTEADSAINMALKLALPQDYMHCIREHAAITFAKEGGSENKPLLVILDLINYYLTDSRSQTILEPLSRKYYQAIKRPRVKQLMSNILGPFSRDATLVNSILEVCYGTSLLPDKLDEPKGFVDFVESLMAVTPANYKLALSVYKLAINFRHPCVEANAIKFWACSLLINSIFLAVPVAPEYVWVEIAGVLRNSETLEISVRFHQQAISVYPFSIRLWQSYLDICRNTESVDMIIESARERGIELG